MRKPGWHSPKVRAYVVLITTVSLTYFLLLKAFSSPYSPLGYEALLYMVVLSFLVFAAELCLFRLLFRALKVPSLGLALASGHLTFICLFIIAMCRAISYEPIYALVWHFVLLPIDPPAFALVEILGSFTWGFSFDSVDGILLSGAILAVGGSLQYYLIGKLVEVVSRPWRKTYKWK